ncbi:3D-(3,5/4)-trihydroxycyclohexane-1,2-dione acylhydrolase (decyclizing) [uncultured Eubacterium sp.]|uniref:3D-(3,5/4)-trihydroxycyclohexane-1,2-dione acylhydrolase (decyclizing) n=1 Tax=uncultured Eubacterium sp. TaxID=165185 RepID=UPI0025F08247|nr:3D-(3,5/4)-trihydroxycyclohexane-1,2-dione acylhydrolase (decyclizing) [uncultured Eubacterium sp.]
MKRERLTMSQALVKFLDNQYIEFDGVESKFVSGIFGIFGHGCVVGVGQALEQGGHNLKFYQGKNEQNMALAAVAYAKQKDRKAIIPCVSSIGPGATNMVTACGCATANRIPLLVLPGDTFACRQPDPVLQQAEFFDNYGRTVTDAFKGVCHYFDRINRPEQLMTACLNAMRVLTDPADTGAVCLAMPQDVEGEAYDYPEHFLKKRVWHIDRRPIAKSQLDRAVRMIKESKKPIIICGGGVRYSGAEKQLLAFVEKYNIPIAETQAGKGIIPWQNPLNLGGIGVTGGKAANVIGRDADLVIGVGTRFSDFTTSSKWLFNENRKVLAINICPFDAYKMDAEAVVADAREALNALTDALNGYKTKYNDEISKAKAEWDAIVDDYYTKELDGGINQTLALGIINEFMGDEDIALGSAGSLPGDMQRLFRPKGRGTYHMEYGFSNMGYEVNGALGAKLAKPEAEVYTFCGDGSFLMGHSELYTAVQEGLKINVCLFDNLGWGCIENLQNNQGTDTFGTVFRARNPKTGMLDGAEIAVDFAKIAEGYGAKGYSIHNSAELRAALEDAKKRTEPVLFDIKVLPKTMTPGFESWWRVGVAEVSKSESVRAAYDDMQKNIKKTFDY